MPAHQPVVIAWTWSPVQMMLIWSCLIGGLGWWIFGNTIKHGYVVDDVGIVRDNPNAAATTDLRQLFKKHYWQDVQATEKLNRNFHYRPLTIASYALVARRFGPGPAAQHAVNVGLHIVVAWLGCWLMYVWLQDTVMAGLAGLCFVAHPLHTEAVAMLVGRAELLAALGALGALAFALAEAKLALTDATAGGQRWLLAAGAGLCLLVGWLAKESAVLFFPLWLLILWANGQTASVPWQRALVAAGWRTGVACGLASLGFWFCHQRIQSGVPLAPIDFPMNPLAYAGLLERWATGVVLLMKYVGMHLWPFPLQVDYSFDSLPLVVDWRDRRLWSAGLGLAFFLAGVGLAYRRRSPAWVGLLFLLGSAALFSHFIRPLGFVFAERVMYLPSLGYGLALAAGFRAGWQALPRPLWRWALAGAVALLIGSLAWQTRQEVGFYRDSQTVLARSLAVGNQRSVWLWQAYGTEQLNAGHPDEAIRALDRARAILPLAETHAVLAKAYLAKGDSPAALAAARMAARLDPVWMPYRELFGILLFEAGRTDEAAAEFEAALGLAPADGKLHAQLAVIRRRQGRLPEAIHHYGVALQQFPTQPRWWMALGDLYVAAGNIETARRCYRKVVEVDSDAAARQEAEHKLAQLANRR